MASVDWMIILSALSYFSTNHRLRVAINTSKAHATWSSLHLPFPTKIKGGESLSFAPEYFISKNTLGSLEPLPTLRKAPILFCSAQLWSLVLRQKRDNKQKTRNSKIIFIVHVYYKGNLHKEQSEVDSSSLTYLSLLLIRCNRSVENDSAITTWKNHIFSTFCNILSRTLSYTVT